MPPRFVRPAATGFLTAGLFLLVAMLGLGFFFMFLPTLPLLWLALGHNSGESLRAALIAGAIVALLAGIPVAAIFLLFLALPAWYIGSKSLLWRGAGETRQWFPMGIIFLNLTLYACIILAALSFYYASQPGGIEQALAANLRAEFSQMEAEYADLMQLLISQWAFLIFSMTVWLWGLALYAHAWFASRLLAHQHKTIRPDMAIGVFSLPDWVLFLLAVCALASLIGSPPLQFLGKSSLIALLFPYFLSGCAHMHAASQAWPSRRFFLFFIYFMIFAQFWPALALSGIGLFQHIKALSSAGRSSKR